MKDAARKTCMERYGTHNGGWTFASIEKIKKSNIKRHGVEFPMQNPNIREKAANTFVEKYGVTTPFKLKRVGRINAVRSKTKSYNDFIKNSELDEPLFSLEEYIGRSDKNQKLEFKCKKCGNIFEVTHHNGHHSRCPVCWPAFHGVSNEEKEIIEFIKRNTGLEVKENARDIIPPYEVDIYIPGLNLAIEFDGLYWHSTEQKDKKYHLNKTELCESKGIRLIHIFENEWLCKRKITESRLLNALGAPSQTVFARKCAVNEIPPSEARTFIDENHGQGYINSKINIGLFYDGSLVSAMCFSKNKYSSEYEYEMTRFCSRLGCRVTGGAGKLLRYFEKTYHPKSLVSYADRRWSRGKLYESLGFDFVRNSPPNYWYARRNSFELESRIKYQKHKLAEILEKFDPAKTETQNMLENGYIMIYDCGNKVYAKKY